MRVSHPLQDNHQILRYDYIFTDPPFGHNFDYSELNFFVGSRLHRYCNKRKKTEAIVSIGLKQKDINPRLFMGHVDARML